VLLNNYYNKELLFQNEEKEKERYKELAFQNEEKKKRR
jgi:hypothetical protein